MEPDDDFVRQAINNTFILRFPKQQIATFGVTNIKYYIITEPIINELMDIKDGDLVIREGRVIAERPQIITPYYLKSLFHGFEHGEDYSEFLRETQEASSPGLLYKYKNEFKHMSVVSDPLEVVLERLEKEIDDQKETLATIIKGINRFWDISLMKFIFELTTSSLLNNIMDLNQKGLLSMDKGIPRDARIKIENLFRDVKTGKVSPKDLKKELDSWGVFSEYEKRFLDLFV